MATTVIAGDLGGTNLRAALVSEAGEMRIRRSLPTPARATTSEITELLAELFRGIVREADEEPLALCVATAGLVDGHRGRVIFAPNVAGFRDIDLATPLSQVTGLPAFIENDASAAALGEYRFGAGRGAANLLHATLGTGIGGGLVIEGRLYRGAHGLAGEIGHVVIDPAGPRCACGSRGCLEAMASGVAFARRARELIQLGKSERLKRLAGELEPTAALLYEAALDGDPLCEAEIRHGGHLLGLALGSLANVIDPTRITLSGGLLSMGDMLLAPLREGMRSLPYGSAAESSIVLSTLGDDAGLLGAAAVAFERSRP